MLHMRYTEGFTLIELVVVVIIIGVLTTIGIRSINNSMENRKFLGTKKEMEVIRTAIVGDPDLKEGGTRTYFGYIGDTGVLPGTLDDLTSANGVTDWSGPYIEVDFADQPDDYKRDAWGTPYVYNVPGDPTDPVTLTTYGADEASGGTGYNADFTVNIGSSVNALLNNTVELRLFNDEGKVLTDNDVLEDSVYMEWAGSTHSATYQSGTQQFVFSSVPIGNRELHIDALTQIGIKQTITVSVDPGDDIERTVTLEPPYGQIQQNNAPSIVSGNPTFSLVNGGVPPYEVTRMTVNWVPGPGGDCWNNEIAYLGEIQANGTPVWEWDDEGGGSRVGAGSTIQPGTPIIFNQSSTVTLTLIFRDDLDDPSGTIDMTGVKYTLSLDPTKGPTQSITGTIVNQCSEPDLRDGTTPVVGGTGNTTVTASFDNDGTLPAKVDAITVSWAGTTGDKVQSVSFNGTNYWTGSRSSGDIVYLSSLLELDGSTTHSLSFTFNGDMTGISLDVKFHFSDGTTQTVAF